MSDTDLIAGYLNIPPSIARHILEHGLTPQRIAQADLPKLSDPFSTPGIGDSLDKISVAIRNRRSITLNGDGSADATAATATLHKALHKIGARSTISEEKGDLHIELGKELPGEKADIAICPSAPASLPTISIGTPEQITSQLAFSLVRALYLSREKHFGRKLVAIDTETTGTNSWLNEIIEIGAVRIEGKRVTETFSTLIKPSRRIPSEIVRITGITNEDVANAPSPTEALSGFLDFVGDAVLVAHNAPFDIDFIKRAIKKHLGRRMDFDTIDTLEISRGLYPAMTSHRLAHVAENLGIKVEGWHRALGDAVMAANIYITLSERQNTKRREFNIKRYMDIASLGLIASGKALDEDCAVIIRNGLPRYRLDACEAMISGIPEKISPSEVINLLLSWRRKKNLLGALALLFRVRHI